MIVRALDWVIRHTLRSVPFGIALLVLIAGYVAVGSGLASVREYFELDEIGFFNAWPLKLMMVLLVVTLTTVTIQRIPFTPPRYGVWCVHVGIVTLIAGASWHYYKKVEGATLIPVGGATTRFYDRWERALYLQAGGFVTRVPLPSLPRFHSYSAEQGNADYLDRDDLKGMSMMLARAGAPGSAQQAVFAPAAEVLGLQQLEFAVTGYWPYAAIRTRLANDPASKDVGFVVRTPAHGEDPAGEEVLLGAELRHRQMSWGSVEFEHRAVADQKAIDDAIAASKQIHTLAIKAGNVDKTIAVQVGERVAIPEAGYTLQIESFDPDFPAMDGQKVQLLTMLVQGPSMTYRRQLIPGRDKPTDWKLNEPGAGPLGKRQTEPLEPAFVTTYTYADPATLMPRDGDAKYTLFTLPNDAKTIVVGVARNETATTQVLDKVTATLSVPHPLTSEQATMAAVTGQAPHRHADEVTLVRAENVKIEQYVEETPKQQRDRDEGQSGRRQVVQVRATGIDGLGNPFTVDTLVPFSERPFEAPWQGGLLNIPGLTNVAQLQLGNNFRPLPVRIKLEKFEAEAYAGLEATAAPMLRDFRSTISITDLKTGKSITDTVYLNSPVKYDNSSPLVTMLTGKSWIFFQSGWDSERQQFTILGIGNRPGVVAMTVGCVMIVVGILYAFYVKPILIRRMKRQALEAAAAKKINGKGHNKEHASEREAVLTQ